MTKFIIQRLARGAVALLLFQSILFALFQALPYDISSLTLGSPSTRDFIRKLYGLNLPGWQQYARWLWDFVRFDLGQSYLYWPAPVSDILLEHIPRTLLLFLSASILAYLFGIWLGKMMAWHRGSLFEVGATLGGVGAYTSFAPFLGFLLINIFGRELGWLPYQRLIDHNVWYLAPVSVNWVLARLVLTSAVAFGLLILLWRWSPRRLSPTALWPLRLTGVALIAGAAWLVWARSGFGPLAVDFVWHLALPLTTVVLLSFGETMMLMRMAMLETMREEYVRLALAIGYSEKTVRDRHVARNAILPVLTRLVLNLPFVLVGSLVIERVFLWQAMGHVVFNAIEFYDVPLLVGILSVVGMLTLSAHLVLDIVYFFLDPRLRHVSTD